MVDKACDVAFVRSINNDLLVDFKQLLQKNAEVYSLHLFMKSYWSCKRQVNVNWSLTDKPLISFIENMLMQHLHNNLCPPFGIESHEDLQRYPVHALLCTPQPDIIIWINMSKSMY